MEDGEKLVQCESESSDERCKKKEKRDCNNFEFLLAMSSARFHWVWKVMAFLYHSLMVVETVSMDMMRHISGGGIPAEKYPIRMLGSEMLASATWFLKVEMYSVNEGEYELFLAFFCIRLVDNQEIAFPVTLWYLNVVLNFAMKSAKVLRENVVPEMVLWRKVAAQVRANPLVMYERAKAICLSSLS